MFKRITLLAVLSILCSAAVQAQDAPRKPFIIDTDMAADDWMAIVYLLSRTDVEVKAITVTGTGEAHCNPGVQNAMNLVAVAGSPEVPVACGRETPLDGNHTFPQAWREGVDNMQGLTLAANPNPPDARNAVQLLIDIIGDSPDKVTLVTLGPLTNIAEWVQADPSGIDNLEMMVIMGGAISVPGNLQGSIETDNTTAEWNIYVDPHAANIVIESGAPVTLVPLDATNDVPVTMAFYRVMQKDHATPAADFVFQALTSSLDFIQSGGYWFWDSLAAVVATEGKNVVAIQGGAAHVIVGEGEESGRTVLGRGKGMIRAAYHADREKFEQIFLNVLNGRDPYAVSQVAAAEPGDPDANKAIVRRYFEEGWGEQNSPAIDELVDPGYVSYNNSDDFAGNLDSLKVTIASFHQLAPDMTVRVDQLIAEGDTVAARVVITGTHTGDVFNLKPTNKPITITINSMVSLSDGKIVEEWQAFDALSILITIGVIPEDILSQFYNTGS